MAIRPALALVSSYCFNRLVTSGNSFSTIMMGSATLRRVLVGLFFILPSEDESDSIAKAQYKKAR